MRETIGKRIILIVVIFFILTGGLSLWPQSYKKFERFSREHGLSHSFINCMIQDHRGFLWIGTLDGLNLFDGYECKLFQHDPKKPDSIRDSDVTALIEDRLGNIWFGTSLGGLNKYVPSSGRFINLTGGANSTCGVNSDRILAIMEDSSGILWIGSPGFLYRLDPVADRSSSFRLDIPVSEICEDDGGGLWLGGSGTGLVKFNPANGSTIVYRKKEGDPHGLTDNDIRGICRGPGGAIWVGTFGGGLLRFAPVEEIFTPFLSNSGNPATAGVSYISGICRSASRPNILWIATFGGLGEFDIEANCLLNMQVATSRPDSLSTCDLVSVFEDREGMLWVGGYGSGLNIYDAKKSVFRSYRHLSHSQSELSLSNDLVFAVFEDRAGNVWIGSEGGGLDKVERTSSKIVNYSYEAGDPHSISSNFIKAIHQDHSGYIWVGTNGAGLDRLDPRTGEFENFKHDPDNSNSLANDIVRVILEDHSGILWIGTSHGGLDAFDPLRKIFHHYSHIPTESGSLSGDSVRCICEGRDHTLWIGTTTGGLNRFDRKTQTFSSFRKNVNDPTSISSNGVIAILEDSRGLLWVGTNGGGLNRFDRESGTFHCLSTVDGLPNNVINGILEDNSGRLWLSTNNGLVCYDPVTDSIRSFGPENGLPGKEFNVGAYCRGASGELFFGGIHGLVSFLPEEISPHCQIPPVQFTDFNVLNRDYGCPALISEVDELRLSYKDTFVLEFAALSYSSPNKNQYAYKLSELHDDWIPLGNQRAITFAHMKPGNYVLRVKGSNADGVWNEEGAAIRLVIDPPVWQTWWFKVLMVLLTGVLAYYWHTVRLKNATLKLKTESALHRLFVNFKLSEREQEIAALIMKGNSNKDIEDKLFISINTVKSHIYSIYRKMGVKSRLEMINLVQKMIRE